MKHTNRQKKSNKNNDLGVNTTLIFGIIFMLTLGFLTIQKVLPIWIFG